MQLTQKAQALYRKNLYYISQEKKCLMLIKMMQRRLQLNQLRLYLMMS